MESRRKEQRERKRWNRLGGSYWMGEMEGFRVRKSSLPGFSWVGDMR